ncbi:DUF4384 domain-containing protein [Rhodobacterales bacterium]|nr:DUF4384 domain-containing protein [Rhodobacterales bacterium]
MSFRDFKRSRLHLLQAAGAALCLSTAALPASAGEWRALVIGIDAYENVTPLNGARNDAMDIASTLEQAGVTDLTTLYDGEATRQAILNAWQDLIERAAEDDILVLSYAGHGAQEQEWIPGSEDDGLDEVFLLAGFDLKAPGNGERIRDDEVAAMLEAAGGRRVMLIADSCHSGTMTRSIDPRVKRLGTRMVGIPPLENDALRSQTLDPILASVDISGDQPEQLPNVIYVGATVDGQVIPELMIAGEPRGALSWSFARGVEGRADFDKDGGISMEEMSRFLQETVRVATEGRQTPSVNVGGATRSAVLPRVDGNILERDERELSVSASSDKATPFLMSLTEKYDGRLTVINDGTADLFWDVEEGDVLTKFGDVVLRGSARNVDDLDGVVSKWMFLSGLYEVSRDLEPIEGKLQPSVGHIREGNPFKVGLRSEEQGYMAVFALEADGTLRLLAPNESADPLGKDTKVAAMDTYELNLRAALPFGADHIVMVRSSSPMPRLLSILKAMDGRTLDADLQARILGIIGQSGEAVGIAGVYTEPAG